MAAADDRVVQNITVCEMCQRAEGLEPSSPLEQLGFRLEAPSHSEPPSAVERPPCNEPPQQHEVSDPPSSQGSPPPYESRAGSPALSSRMLPMRIVEPPPEDGEGYHLCCESTDSCLISCLQLTKKRQFVFFLHCLVSFSVVVLFTTSLTSSEWRLLHVNRKVLVLLREAGKIQDQLLQEDIAFSRTEGIYKMCFRSKFIFSHFHRFNVESSFLFRRT